MNLRPNEIRLIERALAERVPVPDAQVRRPDASDQGISSAATAMATGSNPAPITPAVYLSSSGL